MKKNLRTILAIVLALVLSIGALAGCTANQESVSVGSSKLAAGGTLFLKVNPEIAITYDESGNVTALTARNEDAKKILEKITDYQGKPAKDVVSQLVTAIGDAGYFVEELEGNTRKITIEIESGSSLPSGTFLEDVIGAVKKIVENHDWAAPIDVEGEDLFGLTDYQDTDYGTGSDGCTDYGHDHSDGNCTEGCTDYDDTDYGPNNDGCTDYGHDHSDGNCTEGCTDYDDTDYGPNNDGVTDYGKTDYGTTDYDDGKTDYNDDGTDYHDHHDHHSTDYGTDYH